MTEWFLHPSLKRPLTWDQAMHLHGEMTDWFQGQWPEKTFSGREVLRDEGSTVRNQFGVRW